MEALVEFIKEVVPFFGLAEKTQKSQEKDGDTVTFKNTVNVTV
jgi:hypothetical protein